MEEPVRRLCTPQTTSVSVRPASVGLGVRSVSKTHDKQSHTPNIQFEMISHREKLLTFTVEKLDMETSNLSFRLPAL